MDRKSRPTSNSNFARVDSPGQKMSVFQHASFYTTVAQLRQLPAPDSVEIAFAGRSNAGKSSAINSLTNRSRLAFVSKTPGHTQNLNFFHLNGGFWWISPVMATPRSHLKFVSTGKGCSALICKRGNPSMNGAHHGCAPPVNPA